MRRWPHRAELAILLCLALLLAACDMAPTQRVSTPIPPAASPQAALTPTSREDAPAVQPVPQGWIFTLDGLKESNAYRLDLDVLSDYGWPVGEISLVRGRNYEKQGEPGLMSTVQLVTKHGLVLE